MIRKKLISTITINNYHVSALQHSIHDYLHNSLIRMGIRRISYFQQVLLAYPTCHSQIIMAHVSLGHLECHWKAFNRQLIGTCQLLHFLNQQPSTLTQLLSMLQVELTNIEDMYNSCKTTIISAINLLNTNPSFDGQS